jgi:hypothetical protein
MVTSISDRPPGLRFFFIREPCAAVHFRWTANIEQTDQRGPSGRTLFPAQAHEATMAHRAHICVVTGYGPRP